MIVISVCRIGTVSLTCTTKNALLDCDAIFPFHSNSRQSKASGGTSSPRLGSQSEFHAHWWAELYDCTSQMGLCYGLPTLVA